MQYNKILPILVVSFILFKPVYSKENLLPLSIFIQKIWRVNPTLKIANAKVDAAKAKHTAASKQLYNPEVGFSFDDKKDTPMSKIISISQSIDWNGKASAAAKVASFDVQTLIAKQEQVQFDLAINALSSLAKYQLTAESLILSDHQVKLMKRFATFTSNAFKIGDVNQSDYNLAHLAYSQALMQNANMQIALVKSKQALDASIGFSMVNLPVLPKILPTIKNKDIQNLIEKLPKINLLKNQLMSVKSKVSQAILKKTPDPTISLTGGKSEGADTIGLSLSIPFNIFNDYSAEVDVAKYQVIAKEKVLKNAYYSTQIKLKNSQKIYQLLRNAWQTWQKNSKDILSNQIKTLENKFKAGDISVTNYLVQMEQILNSKIAGKDLYAKAWEAWFDWLSVSGEVKQWLGEYK